MLFRCALLILGLHCVKPSEDFGIFGSLGSNDYRRFSLWPSVHNGAKLRHELRVRRESQNRDVEPVSAKDGVVVEGNALASVITSSNTSNVSLQSTNNGTTQPVIGNDIINNIKSNETEVQPVVPAVTTKTPAVEVISSTNTTVTEKTQAKELDLNSPGVLMRGFIVFGGFSLLAVAYFVFYRRKKRNNDSNSTHNAIDANQFRYGVLQSDDRRDNLELSRVPLTMESDDDEDEDMEIFDLEQKKKSLSYVNLQTNDEDIVLSPSGSRRGHDMDNLLLDIEDGNSDTLINWSNSGNKTIL